MNRNEQPTPERHEQNEQPLGETHIPLIKSVNKYTYYPVTSFIEKVNSMCFGCRLTC